MVGPWQVPVADVAVTTMGYQTLRGEAFAMGERTPLAILDAPASGRMAVGEALTNIAAASIENLGDVKLSANWMAPAGVPGEDARLFDTVRAVSDICQQIGVSIPVGKDSLSMRTAWDDAGEKKQVVSPLSLIVSSFAPVQDVRRTLTPQLQLNAGESELLLIDLGAGKNRLGGSALAQVFNATGSEAPDVNDPAHSPAFFGAIQRLSSENLLLAYHDRADGGLFASIAEMAFASRCGVSLELDALCDGLPERSSRHYLLKNSVPWCRFAAPSATKCWVFCAKPDWVSAWHTLVRQSAALNCGSVASLKWYSAKNALICTVPGRKQLSACKLCAITRNARSRNTTAFSMLQMPVCRFR